MSRCRHKRPGPGTVIFNFGMTILTEALMLPVKVIRFIHENS